MKKLFFLACCIWNISVYGQSVLPAPVLISPVNQKLFVTFTNPNSLNIPIEFKWDLIDKATHYRFQISRDNHFPNLLLDRQISTAQIQLDSLFSKYKERNLLTLYWRVKAINNTQESSWTNPNSVSFSFLVANEEQNVPQNIEISPPYPNPFSNELSLSFHISKTMQVQIQLYDLIGKSIKPLYNGVINSSTTLNWMIDNLPNAPYLLLVKTNDYVKIFRVISKN